MMQDAFIEASEIKALSKTKLPEDFPTLFQTYFALFAFSTSLKLNTLHDHYAELFTRSSVERHIDLIIILDQGILTLAGTNPNNGEWANCTLETSGGKATEEPTSPRT